MCIIYYHKLSGIYSDILSNAFSLASILKIYLAFFQSCKTYIVWSNKIWCLLWHSLGYLCYILSGIRFESPTPSAVNANKRRLSSLSVSYCWCFQSNVCSLVCAVGPLGFWGEFAAHMLAFAVRSRSVDIDSDDKLREGWWKSQEGCKEGRT